MNAPTSLIPLVEANPLIVLQDAEKFDRFYSEIRREIDAHVPDLTTVKGRDAIKSLAYKVARTKTAIDEAGKRLNEEARAQINKVDEARRTIRAKLDELKDEVRKPLDEWEAAEAARAQSVAAFFDRLKAAQAVTMEDTAKSVEARRDELSAIEMTEEQFLHDLPLAVAQRDAAVETLAAAAARLHQEEADRAELERLRAEAAVREEEARREAEKKAAEEAAAKAKAEEEERERLAAEREAARVEAAAKAAEDAARAQAERKAAEEQAARDRAHAEALAAEKRRADEAEAARKAEEDRKAAEAAAKAKREADIAHRSKVMAAAKTAIMGHGVGETAAKAIVLAIAAGDIPNVTISF